MSTIEEIENRLSQAQLELKCSEAEPPDTKVFSYLPIPQDKAVIRIIRLLPGEESSPLICELEHARCLPTEAADKDETFVKYDALSYAWGDNTHPRTITLNGCAFRVTPNLHGALLRLRDSRKIRTLWIDAICINQSDSDEKSRQVLRMCDIYSRARQVIVWLGEETEGSEQAVRFATKIYHTFSKHSVYGLLDDPPPEDDSDAEDDENFFDWMEPHRRRSVVEHLITEEHLQDWVELHNLFRRPYWERAWIFQEVVIARRILVLCGRQSKAPWSVYYIAAHIAHDTIRAVWSLIQSKIPDYPWLGTVLNNMAQLVIRRSTRLANAGNNGFGLTTISANPTSANLRTLMSNMDRKCYLPHDQIFSVVALLPQAFPEALNPNYRDPKEKVYKSAVKAFIEITGSLNIICYAQYSLWYPEQQSSWMPDWTRRLRSLMLAGRNNYFKFGNTTKANVAFSDDLSILTAEGFVVGVISQANLELDSRLFPDIMKQRNLTGMVEEGVEVAVDMVKPGVPGFFRKIVEEGSTNPPAPSLWYFEEGFQDAMMPILPLRTNFELSDAVDDFLRGFTVMYDNFKKGDAQVDLSKSIHPSAESERPALMAQFYPHLQAYLTGRTIFETKDEILGIGPEHMKYGDFLCVLLGCDVPVVLRKNEDGNFRFIGETHVRDMTVIGHMKGVEDGKYKLEKFNIR